jgi:hypothetical protein
MAANRQRGEIGVSSGGITYTLTLTTNALCQLEAATGRTIAKILGGIRDGSLTDVRWFLWAGLQARHGPEFTSQDAVGEFIDGCGGAEGVVDQLLAANAAPGGGPENPPTAQTGTGGDSISTPGASV